MGPLDQYVKYNEYPAKFLIHIIVLVLSTAQILLIVNYTGAYARSAQRVWLKQFFDEEIELSELDYDYQKFLYQLDELREVVHDSVENYYEIGSEESTTVERYEHFTNDVGIVPPRLSAYYIRGEGRDFFNDTMEYDLFEDNLGPFDDESPINFRNFISNITHIKIEYTLRS